MSVTGPAGFVAAGGAAGIKAGGAPDVAVVATADGRPVPAAGVFTSNLAPAGPVIVSRQHLSATGGMAAAIVLTSGNANAATGEAGTAAAARLCELVGEGVGAEGHHVLIGQTGLIGVPFPIDVASAGLGVIVARRGSEPDDGAAAARAIMTTDTVPKEALVSADSFSVGAMAKGAAMLAPNLATMLAVLTTDARATPAELAEALRVAVGPSFNSLSVDGCTSTNDTVLALASGLA
ncbi:MAG: bifunctional ornithine acetyltransferase/N-acetylglutamate synthase, partial [Acidimicrobiales bacterium]